MNTEHVITWLGKAGRTGCQNAIKYMVQNLSMDGYKMSTRVSQVALVSISEVFYSKLSDQIFSLVNWKKKRAYISESN